MLTEKEAVKKLHDLAAEFRALVKQKQWAQADGRYKTALSVAVFLELPGEEMDKLFGIRGEKGSIIQKGEFPEEMVLKASEMNKWQA